MTRCFHSNSAELSLYEEANKEGWRRDPWNPVPHILHSFNRDDARFLCMEQLMKYNKPPLLTLANYVDFFRQILEGLTFLHEKSIALGTCSDTRTFMVDLSSGRSNSKSSYPDLATTFDRSLLPVKYYFTDLSKAQKVRSGDALKRDVQDCAILFDVLLSDVWLPQVTTKFQNLTKSMLSGTFGADDSRKLLEAMCRSIDGRLFGAAVDGSSILSLRPSTGECCETESPHRQTMSLPMTPGTDDPGSFVNEPGSGRNQRVRHANSYPLPEPLSPC
ncbi:hypothetical protein BDN72DRAFT_767796 [Pluteus cervinus]|uniref:Uncharacterized protein n=1 Tax=Pluteus cervinus TaxID=181527 RepID=A0ACD3AW67_9AGAR|nr:hypothetical protein BDN72DRAFT_767796 [Pluteus cervinus]